MKKIILLTLILFNIYLINATITCNPNYYVVNFNNTVPPTKSFQCTNNINESVQITKTGSYFTLSESVIGPAPSTKTVTLTFNPSISTGSYQELISFSDGSSIPIVFTVTKPEPVQQNNIIIFPTAKVINIQQGQEKQQNVQIIVPSTYPNPITIQSVNFNPDIDITSFGDLDLGQISPGQTLNIPIKISAKDVQTGTYSTQINILATDTHGQISLPTSSLQVVVSIGVNPTSGVNITKPTCSLSATEFNMNTTYSFICNNAINNIDISPQYNEYIEGISAGLSGGVYTYNFKAIKIGTSNFIATFNNLNSPIFTPYNQEFKVTPSGNSPISGTVLKTIFYQDGVKKDSNLLNYGLTNLIVVDNKTDSIVDNCKFYLGGLEITNQTLILEPDKEYDLIAKAPGYLDLNVNFKANPQVLKINFDPIKELYEVGEVVNITTEPADAILLVNDVPITSPYTIQSPGNLTIKAVMEDYLNVESTVNVKTPVSIQSCSVPFEEWKKGKEVFCDLTEPTKWQVYRDSTILKEGESQRLDFKISDYGMYIIKSKDSIIFQKSVVKGSIWYNPLTWSWVKSLGYWWILIAVVIAVLFIYMRSGSNSGPMDYTG